MKRPEPDHERMEQDKVKDRENQEDRMTSQNARK